MWRSPSGDVLRADEQRKKQDGNVEHPVMVSLIGAATPYQITDVLRLVLN
jgi:hypothetical protein